MLSIYRVLSETLQSIFVLHVIKHAPQLLHPSLNPPSPSNIFRLSASSWCQSWVGIAESRQRRPIYPWSLQFIPETYSSIYSPCVDSILLHSLLHALQSYHPRLPSSTPSLSPSSPPYSASQSTFSQLLDTSSLPYIQTVLHIAG